MRHSGLRGMKTAVAAAVAAAMTMPLTACGGQEQATVDENGKPIVRIMVRRNVTDNPIEDMGYDAELEAACDCTIEWSEVDDNSWGQQKAPRMAAGEFPDIGLTLYDYTDISRFYSEFLDLAPYLDQMPNVKKFFEDRPVALKMAQDGDKIYNIPSDRGKGYRVSATHMFINKTWLDNLGLEVPTTWDELEDVLEAFKTEDPNGNGEADEVPMNIRSLGFGLWSALVLLNSTGIATSFMGASASSQGFYVEDGKVKSYYTSENLKDVMTFLHELVEKGLIPKDSLTRDASQYDAQTIGDGETAATGVSIGWSTNSEYGQLADQYITLPPLKQDASMPDSEVKWDYSADATEFAYSVTVSPDAPNLDAVLKVIDAMYGERLSVEGYFGSIPAVVSDDGDHQYTINPDVAYAEYTDTRAVALQDRFGGYIPDDVTMINDTNAEYVTASDEACKEALANVDPTGDVIPIYVRPDSSDMETLQNNNTSIGNYANNMIAQWFQNGGIDEQWDEYVAKLNTPSLGLQDNIDIWQKYYDEAVK